MTRDDLIIRAYLEAAHNRGGSYQMAMHMLVQRIDMLEDLLMRAGKTIEPDKVVRDLLGDAA